MFYRYFVQEGVPSSSPPAPPAPVAPGALGAPSTASAPSTAGPSFISYMQAAQGGPAAQNAAGARASSLSPFSLPGLGKGVGTPQASTLDATLQNISVTQTKLDEVQGQLRGDAVRLSRQQRTLLENKLSDIPTGLRAINARLGTEEVPGAPKSSVKGPLGRLLEYLADGHNQLNAAVGQLQSMQLNGSSLNPADFLLVQVKLNKAQQELEFCSILLSKGTDALKTLLQVPL